MLDLSVEFEIKDFNISKTRKEDIMGNLMLINCNNRQVLNCKIWENFLTTMPQKIFRAGNIIKITDGDYNEQYKNCIVRSLKLIKEAPIGLDEKTKEKLFNDILSVINNFKDEKLKTAIYNKISENEKLFKIAPAAKSNHHNYAGGLMQHIWECIELAQSIFPVFKKKIDQDLILAGCIMHDIGKIFEYDIDLETGIIEVNEQFKKDWITHTQYGFCWAMNNNFKELARIIAAHHSRNEWEAIIDLGEKNLEPELYLMHHVDDLSAKFGMISLCDI